LVENNERAWKKGTGRVFRVDDPAYFGISAG
jgi:hypothetical protein